jgi:hypothetical protein
MNTAKGRKIGHSIAKPSKIYQNWDFWSENMPSGNPAMQSL